MGLQHEGAHARVFRGVDAGPKHVQLRKRETDYQDNLHRFIHMPSHNTNHGNIKMNVPEGFEASSTTSAESEKSTLAIQNKAQADDEDVDVETVYSVVYQTASQTFEGTPAGYVTETAATTPTNIAQSGASTTAAPAAASSTGNADEAAYESIKAQAQGASSASPSSSANAYPTRQMLPNASSSAISASTDVSDATSAIAGTAATNTAVGANVLGGSPLAATRTPEESNSGMTGGAKAGLAFGLIIGLGLIAGLAFFCYRRRKNPKQHEEINEKFNEKSGFPVAQSNRFSADSDKSSLRSSNTPATAPRLSLRPVTQFLPNLTNNNAKDVANTPVNEKASAWERRPQNSAQNPFGDAAVMSEKQTNPFEEGDGHDRNNSMSSTGSGEQVGTAAAVPVTRGPNNVHRVQLDFKPSMEDELELISGQLVRMLHEYDDGWALCIRMDRTQQGVVPRTCLSKLPVKPRGPPQGRPSGPPSNGMPSPPSGADAMAPRPLTPTSTRSRSGTMEAAAVPARKPVPGQAL